MTHLRNAILFVVVASFSACPERASTPPGERPPDAAVEEHADEEGHEALPDKVKLPANVISEARIATAEVQAAVLPVTLELTGELTADPDASAEVALPVAARILEVRFKEGQRLKKGDVLVVAESPELAKARAALTGAQARARAARQNADRLRSVAAKGLASGQEVSVAAAEAETAEADEKAALQVLAAFGVSSTAPALGAARLVLTAPLEGFATERHAIVGQSLPAEHVVAKLARFDRAYFLARLFEKDLGQIVTGATVEVRLNAYPDEHFVGTVESIGRQLDPNARTVVARIQIKDPRERLRDGLFGSARVSMQRRSEGNARPVVPLSAVTDIAGKRVVFVRHADGDFEVHPVQLGPSAEGRVEVLSGIRVGEQVVVDGVFTLKSAVLKSTFGEE